jgi:hypothetical protein
MICVQVMVITSDRVQYIRQGTFKVVDSEPVPPKNKDYRAAEGWKLVTDIVAVAGGEDYQFPVDQILLVTANGAYRPIIEDTDRQVGNMDGKKRYLVWYHHLWTTTAATTRRQALVGRKRAKKG